MTKKDFIALADAIKKHDDWARPQPGAVAMFSPDQLDAIADFCQSQNSRFLRDRWLGYIRGENSPNGGAVKAVKIQPARCNDTIPKETKGQRLAREFGTDSVGQGPIESNR